MLAQREICFTYKAEDGNHEIAILNALCEGFDQINLLMIDGNYAAFANCGALRYVDPRACWVRRQGCKKATNCQRVKGGLEVVESGYGTCIDLACLVCAWHRYHGNACSVLVVNEIDERSAPIPEQYHAVVQFAGGQIIDPSELAQDGELLCGVY